MKHTAFSFAGCDFLTVPVKQFRNDLMFTVRVYAVSDVGVIVFQGEGGIVVSDGFFWNPHQMNTSLNTGIIIEIKIRSRGFSAVHMSLYTSAGDGCLIQFIVDSDTEQVSGAVIDKI